MPVLHSFPFPPPIVAVDDSDRLVSTNTLTESQRQLVWSGIKGDNPELARILKEDENFKEIKDVFQALVVFPAQELNRYMQIGQAKK